MPAAPALSGVVITTAQRSPLGKETVLTEEIGQD